jgi:hypothetical protein
MKPYGIKRFHHCCPGHDRHPVESYSNRRSKKARARGKTISAKRERTRVRIDLAKLSMTEQPPAEQLSTGIAELDALLSGEERQELYVFVADCRPADKPITPYPGLSCIVLLGTGLGLKAPACPNEHFVVITAIV